MMNHRQAQTLMASVASAIDSIAVRCCNPFGGEAEAAWDQDADALEAMAHTYSSSEAMISAVEGSQGSKVEGRCPFDDSQFASISEIVVGPPPLTRLPIHGSSGPADAETTKRLRKGLATR